MLQVTQCEWFRRNTEREFSRKTQLCVLPKVCGGEPGFSSPLLLDSPVLWPLVKLGQHIFSNVDSHAVGQGGIHGIFLQLMVPGVSFPCLLQQ